MEDITLTEKEINKYHQKLNGILRQENKHLEEQLDRALLDYDELQKNWEELKRWINEDTKESFELHFQVLRKSDILYKMQEIEKGD